MTNILVLQHEENCGLGRFERWLTEGGAQLTVVNGLREPIPGSLDGFDAVIVLGGSMNADSDELHPWLTPVKARIREAVERDVPLLGLCLGLQLAVVALGGEVQANDRLTIGLTPELRTLAGLRDPLFGQLADPVVAVHYNGDHVTRLPQGAAALGHAPDGQLTMARLAPRMWGVQFHPEVTLEGFQAWTLDKSEDKRPHTRVELEQLVRAVVASDEVLERTWRPVCEAFLAQVE